MGGQNIEFCNFPNYFMKRKGTGNFKFIMTGFLTLLLFFYFSGLNGQQTATPPGSGGTQGNAAPGLGVPPVKIRPIVLDLCNSIKHVYFKVSFDGDRMRQSHVRQVQFTLRKYGITIGTQTVSIDYGFLTGGEEGQFGGTTLKRDTFPWSTEFPDYIDLEFYNIINVDDDIEMEIKYYDQYSVFISEVILQVPLTKDEGIVDVTDHLGGWIDAYMDQGVVAGGLMTWFCGKEISQIELVAFFKDYFGWSEVQICNFVQQFNLFTSISSGSINVNNTHYGILCTILDDWQRNITGGGGGGGENDCLCKMIRTTADALSIGVKTKSLDNDCKEYTPELFERHYLSGGWNHGNDDDMLLLSGKMGAAKGEIFYAYVDGCDALPDGDGLRSGYDGYGRLTFRSVCVDPSTLAIPAYACKNCTKEIEFQYNYISVGQVYAKEWDNIVCDEQVGITVEEFAVLVIENNGETTIADSTGYKLLAECDGESGWNLDSLINKGEGLYNAIKNLSGVSSYFDAAKLVANVISGIVKPGCAQIGNGRGEMGGTKIYILNPGQRFTAVLYSESTYKARGESAVMGWASVLSDYYMTAVLKTIPDSTGSVPDYCTCEAIASYTWGSMDGQQPSSRRPRDKDKSSRWPDFAGVYNYPPLGETDIKQLIGSFIGTAGEWGDKFDKAGCCAVVIPCHADCVYILGCDEDEQLSPPEKIVIEPLESIDVLSIGVQKPIIMDTVSMRHAQNLSRRLHLYPNPATNELNITFDSNAKDLIVSYIEMYDILGRRVKFQKMQESFLHQNASTIQVGDLISGQYFVRSVLSDGSSIVHPFIKF